MSIVEGRDDKRVFERLMGRLFQESWREAYKLDIDTAQDLISDEQVEIIGNREKVEHICNLIGNSEQADKFVGFVDRENRGFICESELLDEIGEHNVLGRLVWSRGHSIENYFFDFSLLREPLMETSITDYFSDAIVLFESLFASTLRLACVASLVGKELNNIKLIKGSISWRVIEIEGRSVTLNFNNWKDTLIHSRSLSTGMYENIREVFAKWEEIVHNADISVIRWLCHGHIGLTFIWAVFARCVFEVCNNLENRQRETEPTRVLGANESIRFNICAGSWVRNSTMESNDFPKDVFSLLGF